MPLKKRRHFLFLLDGVKKSDTIWVFANNKIEMGTQEISCTLTVQNKMGIHARPAAMIVRVSNKYPNTDVFVEKDGEQVNGKSIMSLMMLAAGKGSEIKFVAQGDDAQTMLNEISALFEQKFGEE